MRVSSKVELINYALITSPFFISTSSLHYRESVMFNVAIHDLYMLVWDNLYFPDDINCKMYEYICDQIWENPPYGIRAMRIFSSSGRNLSKSRFCHIHVEQPFF